MHYYYHLLTGHIFSDIFSREHVLALGNEKHNGLSFDSFFVSFKYRPLKMCPTHDNEENRGSFSDKVFNFAISLSPTCLR